jgi:peroxiredoxin
MLATQMLSDQMAVLRETLSAQARRLYDELVKRLTDAATVEGALKEGDVFPEFALPDDDGSFVLSSDLLKSGPLVINFYRGRWCQFCAATLQAMSAAAPAISAAGATVIGISPEAGHLSFSTHREPRLNFKMLCDLDNGLALQCGLLFRLTEDVIRKYLGDSLDLTQVYGNGSWFLPIPATYIVLPHSEISRAYVNPDFRFRMEPQDILRAVQSLKPR